MPRYRLRIVDENASGTIRDGEIIELEPVETAKCGVCEKWRESMVVVMQDRNDARARLAEAERLLEDLWLRRKNGGVLEQDVYDNISNFLAKEPT